jgi:hypothetical protein
MDANSGTVTNADAARRYRTLAAHHYASAARASAARVPGSVGLAAGFTRIATAADAIASGFEHLDAAERSLRRFRMAQLDPCSAAEEEASAAAASATRPT